MVSHLKQTVWRACRLQLARHPVVSHPIWKARYRLFPREIQHLREAETQNRSQAFSQIFEDREWSSEESKSGYGSELKATITVRRRLPRLLESLKIKTLLDAPCGDFNWMSHVTLPPGVRYIGADIVPGMIEALASHAASPTHRFMVLDIVKNRLPEADLWLCRHSLFHLPIRDVREALENFRRSTIRYLLTSNHNFPRRNFEVNPGGYRFLNLRREPFNLPRPLLEFDDFDQLGPPCVLALWSREQLGSLR